MRTPSELMNLFALYDSQGKFEEFVDLLTYEEVTMMMMVAELLLKNPSLDELKIKMYKSFLETMGGKRKQLLERN